MSKVRITSHEDVVLDAKIEILADRERDRQHIARLTGALRDIETELGLVPAMAVPRLVESFKRHASKAQRIARAVLAGEEEGE